ncbi:Dihydrofolate reductase [Blastococcus aggregatus]|uniref:Dihydrofolate reductase n=1 Tax=Blastococcus aggregatus TaxID=38502 RepID=A0A285VF07_9ACTN|nr:dihydrofolate reductase family protein [Blastococcus aggregatus]SOC52684.1 Dihydrofolate reductase [Blastococcus aggregatus]
MRKVVLYELMTLDGVAEEPGDWMFEVDDEVFDNLAAVISSQTDVLLGRGTFDYWAGYWPTSHVEPFAGFINTVPKHVVTSTPLGLRWSGAEAVTERAEDHVASLKAGHGGDIGVHGSITLAQSLLQAGLVDELRLVIVPTIAHRGRRLFPEGPQCRRLDLVAVRPSPTGNLFVHYAARAT